MTESVYRTGVVGCGTMGAGITEVCLRAGLDVRVLVSSAHRVDDARRRVTAGLRRAVAKGRMTPDEHEAALGRLRITPDPAELADRQLVVEATSEELHLKRAVFKTLDHHLADPTAVLASTTSSLLVNDLAEATGRPASVVGLHFFNPVPAMPLVELVLTDRTSEHTAATAETFAADTLGKEVIRTRDRCGFVVNALLVPYLMAAVRMYDQGVADAEDIDRGMTLGCGYPMGPLALLDMIGIDTITSVARGMRDNDTDLITEVPPLLTRMVEEGRLGRKSGWGFYRYDGGS
ncbi:3-hydroxybutyryl-CoA dehydrogenase [Streptomyces naphthomycinicus]|uniref:3-hydroxybutyryl-CoA dehydrogenase n=1 Tax=Streptomyces naphthomycinicus TaxID=2872625 RepID=UPI001CED1E8B|nr:3-hydroxybutyryl-CoA dehydrogenase [Streptomyces sp. TML10]